MKLFSIKPLLFEKSPNLYLFNFQRWLTLMWIGLHGKRIYCFKNAYPSTQLYFSLFIIVIYLACKIDIIFAVQLLETFVGFFLEYTLSPVFSQCTPLYNLIPNLHTSARLDTTKRTTPHNTKGMQANGNIEWHLIHIARHEIEFCWVKTHIRSSESWLIQQHLSKDNTA